MPERRSHEERDSGWWREDEMEVDVYIKCRKTPSNNQVDGLELRDKNESLYDLVATQEVDSIHPPCLSFVRFR